MSNEWTERGINRRTFDLHAGAPKHITSMFEELTKEIFFNGKLPFGFKTMVSCVASVAAGCQHCQVHGAAATNASGVPIEKVQALWEFERSELFSDKERAALRLARDGAQIPNLVTPDHFIELREHFDDEEICELLAVVAHGGFVNRWNDSMAVVTDQPSIDFATEHLLAVGWTLGKHAGQPDEQRQMEDYDNLQPEPAQGA